MILISFSTESAAASRCEGLFEPDQTVTAPRRAEGWARIFWPSAFKNFDASLYWLVRSGTIDLAYLPEDTKNRIEFKLGIIDSVAPKSSLEWGRRVPELELRRAQELDALLKDLSWTDVKDEASRRQLLTHLFLLQESPWIGVKRALGLAKRPELSEWVQHQLDRQIFEKGLARKISELAPLNDSELDEGRTLLKRILRSHWLDLPKKLPIITERMNPELLENIFWNGLEANLPAAEKQQTKSERIYVYNQLSRFYGFVAKVALAAMVVYFAPQAQVQIEKELEEKFKQKANERMKDPELASERVHVFEKAMARLNEIEHELGRLGSGDTRERRYGEVIELFTNVNGREPSVEEKKLIRQKLGLPEAA